MTAAATAGAKRAIGYVDRNVARRVAELLTSDDPAKLQQGLRMAASNQRIANGLRAIETRLTTAASSQLPRPTSALDTWRTADRDMGGFSLTPPADNTPRAWGAVPLDTGGFERAPTKSANNLRFDDLIPKSGTKSPNAFDQFDDIPKRARQ
jgi:hypothetical protein